MFNKNIILKIKNFNFQKAILLVFKFQIYWTIVYFISQKSFGTAYCAPMWLRLFASTMRQPSVPYMPYYHNLPMVPYMPPQSPGDIIANRGAEVGETAGRIIGKIGGAIFKRILGGI